MDHNLDINRPRQIRRCLLAELVDEHLSRLLCQIGKDAKYPPTRFMEGSP